MVDEKLSGAEEAEYGRLQESVARMEGLLVAGSLEGKAAGMLRLFVENAKQRMVAIERQGEHKAEEEKETAGREIGIRYLVEREKALNATERQEYAGLLSHEYFTKSDFGQLEHFYTHSWDKLTDEGKGEMSHRIWEGVRRHEFRFVELPEGAKEREAQEVESSLKTSLSKDLAAIPKQDRSDFLQARENGERARSHHILERPSFEQHIALTNGRGSDERVGADVAKAQTSEAEAPKAPSSTRTDDAAPRKGGIKLNMEKLQLIDQHEASPQAPLTGYANSKANDQGSLPGH